MSERSVKLNKGPSFILLDGGTATELEALGKQLDSALWSAHVIETDPEALKCVHKDFFANGADIVITASYQASPEGYKLRGSDYEHFRAMVKASVVIAEQAKREAEIPPEKQAFGITEEDRLIAGSVGPFGACLGDGSEYRGDYVITCEGNFDEYFPACLQAISRIQWDRKSLSAEEAVRKSPSLVKRSDTPVGVEELMYFHIPRLDALTETSCHLLAIETIPCLKEIAALCALLYHRYPTIPVWVSLSCRDGLKLNSGELISDAIKVIDRLAGNQVVAIGCNCVAPRHASSIMDAIVGDDEEHTAGQPMTHTQGLPCIRALGEVCKRIGKADFKNCFYKAGTLPTVLYPDAFPLSKRSCVVYPNSGEVWDDRSKRWIHEAGSTPTYDEYASYAQQWRNMGGMIIGGCCRTSMKHIRVLSQLANSSDDVM